MRTYDIKQYAPKKTVSHGKVYYYDNTVITVTSGAKVKIAEMMKNFGLNSTNEAVNILIKCWDKHPEFHKEVEAILKTAKEFLKGEPADAIQTHQEER